MARRFTATRATWLARALGSRPDRLFLCARRGASVRASQVARVAGNLRAPPLHFYFRVLVLVVPITSAKRARVVTMASRKYLVQPLFEIVGVIDRVTAGVLGNGAQRQMIFTRVQTN